MIAKKINITTQQINKENQRGSWLYSKYVEGSVDSESFIHQRDATENYIQELKERLCLLEESYQRKVVEIEKSLEWIKAMYKVDSEIPSRENLLKLISKINLFPKKEVDIEWSIDYEIIQVIIECCSEQIQDCK